MDFSNFSIDEFFGMSDDSNPLMMLIWIIPIILFVFYGQRIQLIITSSDVKKKITEIHIANHYTININYSSIHLM